MASLEKGDSAENRVLKKLSKIQERVLETVDTFHKQNGYSPSCRDISAAMNLSGPSSAHYHLSKLENLGYISRKSGISRSIEITRPKNPPEQAASSSRFVKKSAARPQKIAMPQQLGENSLASIPLIGEIAAGYPLLAETNIVNNYIFSKQLIGENEVFMLKVKGDSMINAGIFDGDLVIVRKQFTAEENDIVAAVIENEATLKTFKIDNGKPTLFPQNPAYQPIPAKDANICGKVIGLYRNV